MKRAFLISFLLATVTFAQFRDGMGATAHPLLKTGFGPRAAAMGNAYIGLSNDITGLWWNPASMHQLNTYEAMLSHHEWLKGIRDEFAALVWPQSPKNTFGFAFNFSTATGIEHWDANNQPVPADSLITAYEALFLASYTRELGAKTGVSASLKGMYENLYDASGFGGALDIGFHWKVLPMLNLGVAAQNLGPGMFYGSRSYKLPMQAVIGAALSFDDILEGANFLTDIRLHLDNNISVHAGAELWPLEILALRLGFQSGPQTLDKLNVLAGFTGGIGLLLNNYRIDYAIAPYSSLGLTHRLAVIAAFGRRPCYGCLIVKVVDAETSKPLPANIKTSGVCRTEEALGTEGRWEARDVNPGDISVSAELFDYYPASASAKVKAGQNTELVLPLSKIPPGAIAGKVFDVKTNKALLATISYEGPNDIRGEVKTDAQGNYSIPSLYRGHYKLHAQPEHPKYFPQDVEVTINPNDKLEKDFALLREKEVIVFHNINFESGKAEVLPEFYSVLDQIGQILVDNPSIQVELAGYTDSRPIKTPEFLNNVELSQGRVEAVKAYLVDKFKLPEDRLVVKGYGEANPIASNETEEGRAKNRRVEFKVLTGIEYYHEIRNMEE